jgi:hypothetical protein
LPNPRSSSAAKAAALSEGRVPVCSKDRFKVVATWAAAMLIAASVPACAQTTGQQDPPSVTSQNSDEQVPDQQTGE